MPAPDVNAELMAALIDGRLPPDERERVLSAIDASPEWREIYADALAATGGIATTSRTPTRGRFLAKLSPLQWFEIAAAAAVVIAVMPTLVRRLDPGLPDATTLLASVSLDDSAASTLLAQPIWGATRGEGDAKLTSDARAIRVGAAIASYEFRQQRGDAAAAASALEVATLLDALPGGSVAANAYRALATATSSESQVSAAAQLAEEVAAPRPVQLGAWLQGARFAAAAADTTWFSDKAPAAVSRIAIRLDERTTTASSARQFEQTALQRPIDFIALRTAIDDLLWRLGTR